MCKERYLHVTSPCRFNIVIGENASFQALHLTDLWELVKEADPPTACFIWS